MLKKLGLSALSTICVLANGDVKEDIACKACQTFAVVDQVKVYDNFYKTKPAQENFQLLAKQAQTEYDKMMQEGKVLLDEHEALVKKMQDPAVAEAAKKDLEKQIAVLEEKIQKKGEEINRFRQEKDQKLDEQRQAILSEHFKEISAAVECVAKAKNLDFVLNKSAGAVLYAKSAADITDAVIEQANKPCKNAKCSDKVAPAKK